MSRGTVLWPDIATSRRIRELWAALEAEGVPSMATHTHRLHRPHVSFIVAEDLPVNASLEAVMSVPQEPIRLLVEAVGVFPGGFLYLACVANHALLDEQRRVCEAVRLLAVDPWPHFEPGEWTPHITLGWELTNRQLAQALPIVLGNLPIEGWLDHGGVEDGTTGENWTFPHRASDCN
ncbi:MAG: 2'-5' RNA ligase family protein [Acidimicrobiales bacterium]